MRYTTIIDITQMPAIYRNIHARLVYLHLVCKSGYHDDDRDLIDISLRRLSAETGLSLAAVRNALTQLQKAQLLSKQGPLWSVKKWIVEQKITTRAKTERQQRIIDAEAERRRLQEQREREAAIERQRRIQLAAQGKTPYMVYYEGMMAKAAAGDTEAEEYVRQKANIYNALKQKMSNGQTQNPPPQAH